MRYADTEAEQKFYEGKKYSTLRMLAGMVRYMWIYGKYGIRSGALGIIIILSYAFFRLMAYAKLYELENGITLESVEANYSKAKEKLLADF